MGRWEGFVNRCYLPVGNDGMQMLCSVQLSNVPFANNFSVQGHSLLWLLFSGYMNCGPKQFSMHMCKSKSLLRATVIQYFSLFLVG